MICLNTHNSPPENNPDDFRVARAIRRLEVSLNKVMCDIYSISVEAKRKRGVDDADGQAIEAAVELMRGWESPVFEILLPLWQLQKDLEQSKPRRSTT